MTGKGDSGLAVCPSGYRQRWVITAEIPHESKMIMQDLSNYHPEAVVQHFDKFGIREWERLVQTPADEVSLHIHIHYLEKYILYDHFEDVKMILTSEGGRNGYW